MSGDNEPLMPGREEPLIPFTDRRAPILSRIRERRSKRNNLGLAVADEMAELILFRTEEERVEEVERIREGFRRGLANEFGVPVEAVNEQLVQEFTAMFAALEERDIVNEELLDQTDTSEEDEEEDEDSSSEEDQEEESSDGTSFG